MITIFMCDDSQEEMERYENIIKDIAVENQIDIHFKHFTSGKKMLFYLEENPNEADIIFQDIIMEGINGIETAKKVRAFECNSEIIFLTNTRSYVFDAFDTNPLNYLIKSEVSVERMREIFLKAVVLVERKKRSVFVCEKKGVTKSIMMNSISYFEASNRIVTVHFDNEKFEFYATLESVMDKVKDSCIRIHRSYAVNLTHIKEIRKNAIVLKSGDELPMGVTHAKVVKERYEEFIKSV